MTSEILRLTDVINLGGEVQAPQGHAEQEPQPGHDAVAAANAYAGLGQVQLETADVFKGGRLGGPLEKCSEPLATADMASLRARTQLASVHVLDHALAQRAYNIGTHGQLLSGMRLMTPRSSRQDATAAIDDSTLVTALTIAPSASAGYRAAI
jgi:hypothetical protein